MTSELMYTFNFSEIKTDYLGVNRLLRFYQWAKQYRYNKVTLNLSPVNHIDANLCAILLSLIYKLKTENKLYVFCELSDSITSIFFRNGFMAHLQGKGNNNPYPDFRDSAIPLFSFLPEQDEAFYHYLKENFFAHRGLENIQGDTKTNLRSHYIEVFNNVGLHAGTTLPVFACGQYFPEQKNLRFTLVDLGVGFLPKIRLATNGNINDENSAIIWATEGLNTTKDAAYGPGGTGLKELKTYCTRNNGSFHICSGKGYVNMMGLKTMEHHLDIPFPGSVVNIILRNI